MQYRHILLVEDDPDDQLLFSQALKEVAPFTACSITGNGKEALQQIDMLNPDIIFADINMPVVNGLDMLAALKEQSAHAPVVMMSTSAREELRCKQLGAIHFLLKPVRFDILCAQLSDILKTFSADVAARANARLC
ncbi:response regulator [Chitinophagaceae bacterium MMS25-I14]